VDNFNSIPQYETKLYGLLRAYCQHTTNLTVESCAKAFYQALFSTIRTIGNQIGSNVNSKHSLLGDVLPMIFRRRIFSEHSKSNDRVQQVQVDIQVELLVVRRLVPEEHHRLNEVVQLDEINAPTRRINSQQQLLNLMVNRINSRLFC